MYVFNKINHLNSVQGINKIICLKMFAAVSTHEIRSQTLPQGLGLHDATKASRVGKDNVVEEE